MACDNIQASEAREVICIRETQPEFPSSIPSTVCDGCSLNTNLEQQRERQGSLDFLGRTVNL